MSWLKGTKIPKLTPWLPALYNDLYKKSFIQVIYKSHFCVFTFWNVFKLAIIMLYTRRLLFLYPGQYSATKKCSKSSAIQVLCSSWDTVFSLFIRQTCDFILLSFLLFSWEQVRLLGLAHKEQRDTRTPFLFFCLNFVWMSVQSSTPQERCWVQAGPVCAKTWNRKAGGAEKVPLF